MKEERKKERRKQELEFAEGFQRINNMDELLENLNI